MVLVTAPDNTALFNIKVEVCSPLVLTIPVVTVNGGLRRLKVVGLYMPKDLAGSRLSVPAYTPLEEALVLLPILAIVGRLAPTPDHLTPIPKESTTFVTNARYPRLQPSPGTVHVKIPSNIRMAL